jgi:protein-L-isoaspartate(D-aspartate) O-methyltransferase
MVQQRRDAMKRVGLSRIPPIVAAITLLVFGIPVAADAFGRILAEQNAERGQTNPSDEFAAQRENMVRDQIEKRGIRDPRVLDAMRTVKRHLFVPEELQAFAYADRPLPIGHGQTISQPYIVAFMTEALNLKADDRVLEIGTGSGYQAAVLGEICRGVYTIEIIEPLGVTARDLLAELGYDNVFVTIGDGYQGWPEHAPFDAIMVTCSPSQIPQPLQDQLAEGGRMIIPVGERHAQQLYLLEKKKGRIIQKSILPVLFVPMLDGEGRTY